MIKQTANLAMACKGCAPEIPRPANCRWWLPGVVVVEFKKTLSPDLLMPLDAPKSRKDFPWLDTVALKQIVGDRLVKPPKWTFSFDPYQPPLEPDHQRFVTFYFEPELNVPEIAKKLSAIRGVLRAAAEPKLTPPLRKLESTPPDVLYSTRALQLGLLSEPLAISGGTRLGVDVWTGINSLRNQWYLFRCKADELLNDGITGAGVVVAAIDWGVRTDHEELQNRIAFSYNAETEDADVSSGTFKYHGTATLGLIGAGDNDKGMLGFAPGAELWAIQAQAEGDNLDNSSWAKAIQKARTECSNGKRKVILIEASTDEGYNVEASLSVHTQIKTAIDNNDCVVCVPAGDRGVDASLGPNNEPIFWPTGSILVGATTYGSDPMIIERGVSNWGDWVVVSAPGASSSDVTCCACGDRSYTNRFGGTSGAAAKVAGAMALLLEKYPQLTHQQIVSVLKDMTKIQTDPSESMGTFLDLATIVTEVGLLT